jgi:hypothetical protein
MFAALALTVGYLLSNFAAKSPTEPITSDGGFQL